MTDMSDPDYPPDMLPPPSLPPESKVTLQLALCCCLAFLLTLATVGAVLGVVDKPSLSNMFLVATGVLGGLLTGGSRINGR